MTITPESKPSSQTVTMIKKSTKKAVKKPARRYIRKITYYVAVEGAKASDELPPQPRLMVDTIKEYGRVERSVLLKDLSKKLDTKQPIARLFSFHKSDLIRAKFFKEIKEPVVPVVKPEPVVETTAPALLVEVAQPVEATPNVA